MLQIYILCLWTLLSLSRVGTFFFIEINSTDFGLADNDTNITDYDITHPWFESNFPEINKNNTDFNMTSTDIDGNDSNFTGFNKQLPGIFINFTDDNVKLQCNGILNIDTALNIANIDPNCTDFDKMNVTDEEREILWVVYVHTVYCGADMLCGMVDIANNTAKPLELHCGTCSCDESCLTDRGCCPDVYPKLDPPVQEPSLTQCVPVIFPLNVYTPLNQMQPRTLIIKCPDNTTESMKEIALKCHKDYWQLWESGLQEYAIPVTDRSNLNHHYKNVFCALCHGKEKSELIFWQIQILSEISYYPHFVKNISSFLELLWFGIKTNLNFIFLQFQPPVTVPDEAVACYINSCNLTGQWNNYNNVTERACHLYTHGFNNIFANVFCSMCNVHIPVPFSVGVLPNTFLIDLNGTETEIKWDNGTLTNNCSSGYMYDPLYKTCREFWCSEMFLPGNNQCFTKVRDIQGFLFKAEVQFKLTPPQKLTSDLWQNINSSFTARADEVIEEINTTRGFELEILHINYGHIVNVSYTLDNQGEPIIHDADITHFAFIMTLKLQPRRMSGSQIVKYLIDSINILHQCDTYSNLLKNKMECTSLFLIMSLQLQIGTIGPIHDKIYTILPMYQAKMQLAHDDVFSTTTANPTMSLYQHMLIYTEHLFRQTPELPDICISVNHTCPKLIFKETEYILTLSGIYFPIANKTLSFEYVLMIGDKKEIGVCMEVYNAVVEEALDQERQGSSTTSPTTLMSVVYAGVSIVLLISDII